MLKLMVFSIFPRRCATDIAPIIFSATNFTSSTELISSSKIKNSSKTISEPCIRICNFCYPPKGTPPLTNS